MGGHGQKVDVKLVYPVPRVVVCLQLLLHAQEGCSEVSHWVDEGGELGEAPAHRVETVAGTNWRIQQRKPSALGTMRHTEECITASSRHRVSEDRFDDAVDRSQRTYEIHQAVERSHKRLVMMADCVAIGFEEVLVETLPVLGRIGRGAGVTAGARNVRRQVKLEKDLVELLR